MFLLKYLNIEQDKYIEFDFLHTYLYNILSFYHLNLIYQRRIDGYFIHFLIRNIHICHNK